MNTASATMTRKVDFTTALVLIGLFVALLLGLLSYHSRSGAYVNSRPSMPRMNI